MTNLDMLLLRGPSSGPEEGLNELRYTILTQGIPANGEGMVCTAHALNSPPIFLLSAFCARIFFPSCLLTSCPV